MSLLNWLSREKSAKVPEAAGGVRTQPDRPAPAGAEPNRKSERMARRELLYSVVRESMARAGVLSSSYKFKVLSLDAAGKQFLVMVDLAPSERAEADLLGEIEASIMQRARTRHELAVSAVYWRRNDQVGAGAARGAAPRQQQKIAAPSQPAELMSQPPASWPGQAQPLSADHGAAYDPIQDDEMEAFKAALANGLGAGGSPAPDRSAANGRGRGGSAPPAVGFEDTRGPEADPRSRTISSTQAGDLN